MASTTDISFSQFWRLEGLDHLAGRTGTDGGPCLGVKIAGCSRGGERGEARPLMYPLIRALIPSASIPPRDPTSTYPIGNEGFHL